MAYLFNLAFIFLIPPSAGFNRLFQPIPDSNETFSVEIKNYGEKQNQYPL